MSVTSNVAPSDEPSQPPQPTMPGDKIRTKKWAPKTFNGCMTCKKRRIKCDEGKPACQRCIKSNIKCGGYAPPKIRLFDPASSSSLSSTPTSTPSALPPRARKASAVEPDPGPSNTECGLFQSYLTSYPHPQELALVPRFGTQEEYESFQFFLEKTSDLISQYSQPYLWSVLLPQATWHQPSIKHSIIALASLHQSLTTHDAVAQRANSSFIFHYNRAIRALVADKPSIDIVLAACVIFWALENFNGSGQAAFDHMKAAIKILGEWKSKRRTNDPTNDLISKYIEPTIVDGVKFASRGRVEELADQMNALSLTSRDKRIMNMHYPAFADLGDAESYLSNCIKQILALKRRIQTPSFAQVPAPNGEIEGIDAELFKWMHLFQSLTATGPVYMRRMLIVHNVAANILLDQLKDQAQYNCAREESTRDKDSDSPERAGRSPHGFIVLEMEDMVRCDPLVAAELCRKKPPKLGYMAPIFLVATSARTVDIRRRAINALKLFDTQEGPWNTLQAAKIAEAVLELARELAVPPATISLQHMSFDYAEDTQTLDMTWTPEVMMAETSVTSTSKTVDVRGTDWHGLDIPELIKGYGYQFSTTVES